MPRGSPGTATLRVRTSPQMIATIASSARLATSASASSRVPNRASNRARAPAFTTTTERSPAASLRGQRLQLLGELGVGLHRCRPAGVVGLVDVGLGAGGVELDRLDADLFLACRLVLAVLGPEAVHRLQRQRLLVEEGLLLRRELLVGIEVHDDRHLGVVEPGIDA